MNYPFEFDELHLTSTVLDKLGFTPYWGGSGDYGERRFIGTEGVYELFDIDEKDDEADGYNYGSPEKYLANHFCSTKSWQSMYFLHELYEDIAKHCPEILQEFIQKCESVNMGPHLKSYLYWKENNQNNDTN